MGNNTWAEGVEKRTWADRRVGERRKVGERRQVTHEDNGSVWGPPGVLLSLVAIASELDSIATLALEHTRPNLAAKLHEQASSVRKALGIE